MKLNKKKHKFRWYTYFLIFVDICAFVCFFFAYGPIATVRNWLVTTAITTGSHTYLSYILYSPEHVAEIMSNNYIVEKGGQSDVDAIEFIDYSDQTVYANQYEEQVLKKNEGNDLYKIIPISQEGYTGYLTVVYDSKRVDYAGFFNKYGGTIKTLAAKYNAILAINASGYNLAENNDKYPISIMISNHEIYYDTGKEGALIGMNDDGVLMLYKGTAQEGIDAGLKWAVDFGPYLIVNGEKAEYGDYYYGGYHPRTAIAQRKDGIVLFLTIDGRGSNNSIGATIPQITELLAKYGAYNAANLDGGGSVTLVENGEVVNDPRGWGYVGERWVVDGIIVK